MLQHHQSSSPPEYLAQLHQIATRKLTHTYILFLVKITALGPNNFPHSLNARYV